MIAFYSTFQYCVSKTITFTKFLPKMREHTVEEWKIYSHHNFFRQINSLLIYLVNALFSRNFCVKSVRVNFRNFHTVMRENSHNFLTVAVRAVRSKSSLQKIFREFILIKQIFIRLISRKFSPTYFLKCTYHSITSNNFR